MGLIGHVCVPAFKTFDSSFDTVSAYLRIHMYAEVHEFPPRGFPYVAETSLCQPHAGTKM